MTTPFDDLIPQEGAFDDLLPAKPKGNALVDTARDLTAGVLKIGPTALKGVGDILQLATGGSIGSGISDPMERGMQSINEVVGSNRLNEQKAALNRILADPNMGVSDLASAVVENPRASIDTGISTIGSMLLPAGAAKGVASLGAKAATAAAVGTGAVQNAAGTYTDIESPDQADKYTGAGISGAISLLLGGLTGGGADGIIARRIAGEVGAKHGAAQVAKSIAGAMVKEGGQEAGEEAGNYIGESVGDNTPLNANQLAKRSAYGGALGAAMGGGVDIANQVSMPAAQPAPVAPTVTPQDVAALSDAIAGTATIDSKLQTPPAPEGAFNDLIPAQPPVDIESLRADAQANPPVMKDDDTDNIGRAESAPVPTVQPRGENANQPSPDVTQTAEQRLGGAARDPEMQPDAEAGRAAIAQPDNFGVIDTAATRLPGEPSPAGAVPGSVNQPSLATDESARQFEVPAQLTERATQIEKPTEGLRPGDIVAADGKPFSTKSKATVEAKAAGQGWTVKKGAGGFVVRYQPATEKQRANAARLVQQQSRVNPESDSMHMAIAKLGGINFDQLTKEWGYDPTEIKTLRHGIKRIGTSSGMSLDRAGEALAELGYLSRDEHGKHDLSELFDLFDGELRGDPHYTPQGFESKMEGIKEAEYQAWLEQQDKDALNSLPDELQTEIEECLDEFETVDPAEDARILAVTGVGQADGEVSTGTAEGGDGIAGQVDQETQGAPGAGERTSDPAEGSGSITPARPERRQDPDNRKSVSEMTPNEMRQALLVDELTGLGNRRAYVDSAKKPFQASIDIDSLKWVNDNMGHEAGDQLLAVFGQALGDETQDGYHLSGDEFAAQFDSEQDGRELLERVRERLQGVIIEITHDDGSTTRKNGVQFSYGIDNTLQAADRKLLEDKARREAAGHRAGRGREPIGVSKTPAQRQSDNERLPAPQEVDPPFEDVPFSRNGIKPDEVRAAIAADTFNHDVDVYATLNDAPDYIQSQAKSEGVTGVEGFFDTRTNRVALVAENLSSPERAAEVARHELIGHYGMENMVGKKEMDRLSDRVILAELDGNQVIIDIAKYVDETQPNLPDQRRAREIIAVMAERNMQNSITKRVLDAIRKFLKSIGFTKKDVTDAEIAGLLRDAQAYLKKQGRAMVAGEAAQFSRAAEITDSPAFKKWFGDSKVIDASGKPLVVYRGEESAFSDIGQWFTTDIGTANAYSEQLAGGYKEGANVLPVFLAMRNPLVVDARGGQYYGFEFEGADVNTDELAREASTRGHDGLIVKNVRDGSTRPTDVYRVFRNEQIKSTTGNNGNFDPSNPDIRFSRKPVDDHQQDLDIEDGSTRTNSAAFKKWFGDSKVVDAEGKPLVVYHGTRRQFDVFEPMHPRGAIGNPKGIYFTTSKREAEEFAQDVNGATDERTRIVEAYLSIQSDADGVIRKRADGTTEYIVFNPEQIKSATGNNGDFDPSNPDIRFSRKPVDDRQQELDIQDGSTRDPIRARDLVSTERDVSGRRRWVVGSKGYDRLTEAINPILAKVKLSNDAPDAFKQMMRQFAVDQNKALENAKRVAEVGTETLTAEERILISDIIEKNVAAGDLPPENVAKIAADIGSALKQQAQELVDLGMASPERLLENYLPRAYRNPLLARLTNKEMFVSWYQKAKLRMNGNRLKSRGLVDTVDMKDIEKYQKLGWTLSSMSDGENIPDDLWDAIQTGGKIPPQYAQDLKFLMWRDFTADERAKMGEIRDGILRYAMGYTETQRDIAIGRLFKAIAENDELSSAINPGGWTRVPDKEIPGTDGLKQYGALSGLFVPPYIRDVIERSTQPKGPLMQMYDKALSFWKEGKTVWNPVSHGNNIVSNVFVMHFAGLNPADPRPWRGTVREYRTKGKYYVEAIDNGLFGTEFASKDIQELFLPDLTDDLDVETVVASRFNKVVEALKKAGKPVSWYRDRMQKAYEFEDQFFKLMIYTDRRKAGASIEDAITDTERYIFNYSDIPEGVEVLKRVYSPFFSYTYKAIPMVLHTAMTRPDRLLLPVALLGGANWLAYAITGGDEEEERKGMPEYMQGTSSIGTPKAVRMPFNIDDRPAFMDISRRVPLGDLFDLTNQTGGLAVPAPMMPSHPLFTATAAMLFNIDTFTGKEVTQKSDTSWETAQKRANWAWKQMMPNAPFVPGSWNFDKLMNGAANAFDTEMMGYTGYTKAGDPVPFATALLDVSTGTKIRSFDPERGIDFKEYQIDKERKEVQANIRSATRNKSMTPEARREYIERQQDKKKELEKKKAELK